MNIEKLKQSFGISKILLQTQIDIFNLMGIKPKGNRIIELHDAILSELNKECPDEEIFKQLMKDLAKEVEVSNKNNYAKGGLIADSDQ